MVEGHAAAVRGIRFTEKGPLRILSASHDNTIKIWDYESGALIQTLRGHAGWVRGCDITPDGRLAVSVSHDHQAKLWNLGRNGEVSDHDRREALLSRTAAMMTSTPSSWPRASAPRSRSFR